MSVEPAAAQNALEHDKPRYLHQITLVPGCTLVALLGRPTIFVNTFRREAIGAAKVTLCSSAAISRRLEMATSGIGLAVGLQQRGGGAEKGLTLG